MLYSCHIATSYIISRFKRGALWIYVPHNFAVSPRCCYQWWEISNKIKGFTITPYSVGLLWTNDQLVAEASAWQDSQQTDKHVPDWIRTHIPRKRAAADRRLRLRGHWDRRWLSLHKKQFSWPACCRCPVWNPSGCWLRHYSPDFVVCVCVCVCVCVRARARASSIHSN